MADIGDLAVQAACGRVAQFVNRAEEHRLSLDAACGGGPAELPSGSTTSSCAKGAVTRARAISPGNQVSIMKGSSATLAKPLAFSHCIAHAPPARLGLGPGLARPDFGGDPLDKIPCMLVAILRCDCLRFQRGGFGRLRRWKGKRAKARRSAVRVRFMG